MGCISSKAASDSAAPAPIKGLSFGHANLDHEDPQQLPRKVRDQGLKAVKLAETAAVAAFGDKASDPLASHPQTVAILKLMGLEGLADTAFAAVGKMSAKQFCSDVAECVKLNPILIAFGAEMTAQKEYQKQFPPAGGERDTDVVRGVCWCYVLHAFGSAVRVSKRDKNELLQQIAAILSEKRERLDWSQYTNTFEKMKVQTVDIPMKYLLGYKAGEEHKAEAGSGYGLSLNILEAMYQDVKQDMDDNAQAGFELMMEPSGRAPIKGTGSDLSRMVGEGVILYKAPFPRVWNNLYNSWNLSFCSSYKDWPVFFAKLLNPLVCGAYQKEDAGLYLWPRIITLWMHIHFQIFSRVELKSAVPAGLDWRNAELSRLWGRLNKVAATQYKDRVEKTIDDNYGPTTEIAYDLKRASVRALWGSLRAAINAGDAVGDAGEGAVEGFKKAAQIIFPYPAEEEW